MVSHMGLRRRAFKVKSLTQVGPAQQEFELPDNGGRTTVAQYFQDRYNMRQAPPHLTLLLCMKLSEND